LGDPHTSVFVPVHYDDASPGGIPIYFNAVEDKLYVYGVSDDIYLPLVGHVLVSIENVPFREVAQRHAHLTGNKNNFYNVLGTLRGKLWTDFWIEQIVPEWSDKKKIRIELAHPDGQVKEFQIEIPSQIDYPLKYPETAIMMPSTKKCDFAYTFLDDKKETALLVIKSMSGYREAFEIWQSMGRTALIQNNKGAYERANQSEPPEDENKLIAGIPSVTEVFLELLKEMKTAGSKNLLIDLRRNSGGASTMADILTYFIYGENALLTARETGNEVKKLSEHYFKLHTLENIKQMNEDKLFPLIINDYLFVEDSYGWQTDISSRLQAITRELWETRVSQMPAFEQIYDAGEYNGFYCPERIAVISSCNTFSSAFTLMERFSKAGALIIGRPSGQEPNAFGSVQEYTLNNTQIKGYISHKRFGPFPEEEPDFTYVLKPDYELSYSRLKSYNFDKHADILYALDVLDSLNRD
jgi:hypothetical protein